MFPIIKDFIVRQDPQQANPDQLVSPSSLTRAKVMFIFAAFLLVAALGLGGTSLYFGLKTGLSFIPLILAGGSTTLLIVSVALFIIGKKNITSDNSLNTQSIDHSSENPHPVNTSEKTPVKSKNLPKEFEFRTFYLKNCQGKYNENNFKDLTDWELNGCFSDIFNFHHFEGIENLKTFNTFCLRLVHSSIIRMFTKAMFPGLYLSPFTIKSIEKHISTDLWNEIDSLKKSGKLIQGTALTNLYEARKTRESVERASKSNKNVTSGY